MKGTIVATQIKEREKCDYKRCRPAGIWMYGGLTVGAIQQEGSLYYPMVGVACLQYMHRSWFLDLMTLSHETVFFKFIDSCFTIKSLRYRGCNSRMILCPAKAI